MKTTAPVVLLAVAAMVLSLITLGALLGVRLVAADRLRQISEAMKELGNASIETTITVRQTLPLSAQINIVKPTQIDLTLDVADKIPIRLEVKVDETLTVPLDLEIDEQIPLETAMTIAKKSRVRVKADIDVEQPVRWRLLNRVAPLLNIKGTIPLDQEVEIAFPETLRVRGSIPVKFRLREELRVPVSFEVPVDQMLDLKLAIQQQARVGFPEPLHITGEVPVVLEIPVSIPLQPTPVGTYLRKMAGQLDSLLAW
jgi:hypothetical protein